MKQNVIIQLYFRRKGVAVVNSNKQKCQPILDQDVHQAIFIVNKHAKAAPMPKMLYDLKKLAIQKLLNEGKAVKIGLHFSDNPRNARQQSDVIIQCGDYIFHLPPSKEDIKCLPHLGNRSIDKRNPKTRMSLSRAKAILYSYTGTSDVDVHKLVQPKDREYRPHYKRMRHNQKDTSNIFTSSFLGKDF